VSDRFEKLWEPIKIGDVEIKNRVAMAPMGLVGLLDSEGCPGQRAAEYYLERARGGVGLIITGLFKVEMEIDYFEDAQFFRSHYATARFAELAEAVHAWGAKIFVQLTAGFGRVIPPRRMKKQPVSASAVPYYWDPNILCREITTEEVEKIVHCFGEAAAVLAGAGIDGVELHGHEGYLLDQFTTAVWNKRTDKYGGDLAGRLRFPLEALDEIRNRAGSAMPVQYRFGLKHYMKGLNAGALPGEEYAEAGRDIEEGLEMAEALETAGFDALHVDAGCYDSWYWPHPPGYMAEACMVDMAEKVKKKVRVPVIAVGKLDRPEIAENVLKDGKADMIAIGRGLLSDPCWALKARQGESERIRPCIGCSDGCLGRIFTGRPHSCAVNPASGRERAYALSKIGAPKRVLIAGGGVAGLEAARAAAVRGQKVILCEKTGALGGNLIPAAVPPFKKDLARLLNWYESEVRNLGVEIRLEHPVTPEVVEEERADVVIVATGARPIIPSIPGADKKIVATAAEVLRGRKRTGEQVIVTGGGLVGCETAIWLARQGKSVVLVEMLDELMKSAPPTPHVNKLMIWDMLAFEKVEVITGARLVEIHDEGVRCLNGSSQEINLSADSVVLSLGLSPDRRLYRELAGNTPNLYLVGDAREARNVMGAVWDAYEVIRGI